MFWLYSSLLLILALAFVLYPFFRRLPDFPIRDREKENITAFKQQMVELKQGLKAGDIDQVEFEQIETELKLRLLQESDKYQPKPLDKVRPWGIVAGCLVLVVAFSYTYYYRQGFQVELALHNAMMNQFESKEAQEDYIKKYVDYVETKSDNPEDWYFLGRTFINRGEPEKAIKAFETSLRLLDQHGGGTDQNKSALYGNIAQARFFANDRKLDEIARGLLDQALALDPHNTLALGVSGIAAFEAENFEKAVIQWRKLSKFIDPSEAESVVGAIAAAEARLVEMGIPVPEADAPIPVSTEAVGGPTIQVTIDLDQQMADQARGAKALFVVARAAGGPPMPLAVKRLPISNFPVQVQLDQDSAMGPMAGLQVGMNVEVVARLSMTGVANSQPGDIEGVSEALAVTDGDHNVALTIDTVR